MAPLNEEQLHQIRDERKEQIMRAAIKVFSKRGIFGTKMSMIAGEAGVSHGLLYHYFKSKDELFITLVQWSMDEARHALSDIYDVPGTPLEKITLLTSMILQEDDNSHFMLIQQARTSDGVPEEAKRIIESYSIHAFVDQLMPLFEAGQQAGEIAAGDLRELAACYLSVLSGLMTLKSQEDPSYTPPRAELLLRMLTNGQGK
ncbi:TetR/AcrR family transcriptional regulator [Paenibacillus sp. FSL H8-0457]|uniref:TetR/AcrR family transcriptional regulator n=1 Tax=unclassified Paenibacillus TaxID=185978 RepID=UPI00017891C8|nr:MULTISPECIES: TetR/AcrR family transcriptional regulator [unclassified Paenibacillus]ACX68323.1 transcriptional regulator, TetR family [Paenibacillus sp. Y412MC10]ETT69256.1 TetR family transcriptional regulator [Paenibacillus sp. FSL H8-457]